MMGITQNPDARRALLEHYLRKTRMEETASSGQIPRRDPEKPVPLSFGQQQLWLAAQVIQDVPVYNECVTIHMPGALDVPAMERSLLEMLRRHEAWRTNFPVVDDQPVQVIHPPQLELPVVDLRDQPLERREAEALRLATTAALRPFDLAHGPLLRAMLVHLSDTEHRLYLAMHHIIFDGVSLYQIFLPELWALYDAFSQGKPSPLAEPALQYADYATWQRGKEQEEALTEHLTYWQQQLAGAPPSLELPADHPIASGQSFRGAMLPFALAQPLTDALKALSSREGVTLYMTLLAALDTLFYRYTGQDDILIGTAMDRRNRPELQGIMGYFLNTVVIRTDLTGEPTFQELLRRVRDVVLDAHAHQDAPFEYLVRELQPERIAGRNPFFQVMISLEPPLAILPSGWTLTQMDVETESAKFDLNIELDDRPDGLIGRFEYNSDLFDEATVARMMRHWVAILASVVADPGQAIATLPLLSDQERHQILTEWNATTQSFAPERCIHHLFEEQAERVPDAVAVVYEAASLTYADLNRRANQLAHHLIQMGVAPDTLVGLCLDRSLDMIIALLGIFKAGGAYVPLDAAFPPARIAYMLRDAGAQIVITQHHLTALLPEDNTQIIAIDTDWDTIRQQSDQNPQTSVTPAHLAYVIFTSGSTGAPKGTMIEHRNLYHYVRGISERLNLPARASYATVSTIAADLGNTCIYPALTSGGTLHVMAQDRVYDPDAFADYMHEHAVDCLKLTPSYMATLLTARYPEWVFPRRALLMGGEFSHWPLIERIRQYAPICRIMNHYGPTEATVGVSTYDVEASLPNAKTVPVGRPLSNSRFYILDRRRQPVPVGVAGELYIGGAGLARGYLNRPDLTDERFIPDPFNAGGSLYRTGDLARYLDDGTVELLGRRDDQVKLRGFRVELGEIEIALRQHPAVAEVAVLAREDTPGDKHLVAYIVATQHVRGGEYAAFLKARLAEYMIPDAFVTLTALPLTPNGKLDRNALPVPGVDGFAQGKEFAPPTTALEQALAGIWEDVLGRKPVGIHDDFFALGGHSLMAMRLVTRIRHEMRVDISLRLLFEASTISQLAARLNQQIDVSEQPRLEPVDRQAYRDAEGNYVVFPTSFMQESIWFLQQLDPQSTAYNMQCSAHIQGPFDLDTLKRALDALVRRHEILRTTFVVRDGLPVQVVAPTGEIPLTAIDLRHLDDDAREAETVRIVNAEITKPIDLEHGPLIRAVAMRLDAEAHILCLPHHHTITDGTSMGVILSELATIYDDYIRNAPVSLPILPIQYGDYAVWQRTVLSEEILDRHVDFWREHLRGAPTSLNLPIDRPRPPMQSFRGIRHVFPFPTELMDALKALSRQEGVTLFMTLLAAFDVLLYRHTGQEDMLIGSPTIGRDQPETDHLPGVFINSVVIRGDLAGNPTFRELLERFRREVSQVLAHQDIPFDYLVKQLRPERLPGQNPLFQVMLSYWEVPNLPHNWQQRFVGLQGNSAKFDITVELDDRGDECFCHCEYSTDLFEEATIARMMQHWTTLLASIVADPEQRIATLPMLSDDERRMMIVEWNATRRDYPALCLHQLVEAQALQSPEAIAVTFGDEQLTYGELDRQANQLARHLIACGAREGARIGLCMERATAMVVALLGILKTGAAYVPLDPAFPADRLAYMLEDAQAHIVVTSHQSASSLPDSTAQIVYLDELSETLARHDAAESPVEVHPTSPAYVIYTSGSTGRPKGVQIPHRAAVNLLNSMRRAPGMAQHDVMLATTTLSFDIAVLEIYLPLTLGARVELLPREAVMDGRELMQAIARVQPTIMQGTPTMWRLLLAAGWQGDRRLKILCGGEPLPSDLAGQLLSHAGSLWNMYGPTETTVWSTTCQITEGDAVITIGRPIDNTQIYILDAHLQPTPIGVPGEICIGGTGLAIGYLNRPEITSERFIPHPFGEDPDARIYRTGDLGCYMPNGTIKHLGRLDNQVKVRGHRIELGEIEAILQEHPAVREVAVVSQQDANGDAILAGYVVPEADQSVTPAELRHYLRNWLPLYMIPSAMTLLNALPLTPNGKLDRKALPTPENATGLQVGYVAPTLAMHRQMVEIWEELLGKHPIGITDNFFDLGGHSLLAVRLVARMRHALQVEVHLGLLFAAPTIAELADRLSQQTSVICQPQPAPTIRHDYRQPDGSFIFPASFMQESLWFLQQLDPQSTMYNTCCAARVSGSFDIGIFRRCLDEVLNRHEILCATFALHDGLVVQVVDPSSEIPLRMIDIHHVTTPFRESAAEQIARDEMSMPIDLEQGPLTRAIVIRLDDEDHILCLLQHHIITDGTSMHILLDELSALYADFSSGASSSLPALPIQYADYAIWQRKALSAELLEQRVTFWRDHLHGAPTSLALPTDRPRPPLSHFRGARYELALSQELLDALRALSRREGVTIFTTFLAAFYVLLYRYAGQEDLLVGTPVVGRDHVETEHLLGVFINSIVVRGDLSGAPTFLEFLDRVQHEIQSILAHSDLPFDVLVRHLQPERIPGQNPLFQVMLDYWEAMALSHGWQPAFTHLQRAAARFDLTLSIDDYHDHCICMCEYNADLFEEATIARMMQHWITLLASAVADPEQRITTLPMLSDDERRTMLMEWQATSLPAPLEQTVLDWFDAQVERDAGALAAIFTTECMTYGELNRRANHLAGHLARMGVEPGTLVGLCVERSLDMLVGILGILKAGGAYVPLDPVFPTDRLAFMLADIQAPAVVIHRQTRNMLPAGSVNQLLDLDDEQYAAEPAETANPPIGDLAAHPAYVFYTSGSTGKPKGVLVSHANLAASTAARLAYYTEPVSRLLLLSSFAGDSSIASIFGTLCQGGTLVLSQQREVRDPPALAQLIEQHAVTHTLCMPPLYALLLERSTPEQLKSLRAIIVAGEPCPPSLVRRHRQVLPQAELYNEYGVTEVSIWSTVYRCGDETRSRIPIGKPIGDTQLYILDPALQPVPEGVAGELYIGGSGVALGYLNRPDLTAERFIPNPFSSQPEARLYKTGDQVRMLNDGNLEYLGRLDQQVKVHGYRTELGEIEMTMCEHPAVRAAVVVPHSDAHGDTNLVGYIVSEASHPVTPAELRTYLRSRLPLYLIPPELVMLEALPLTPNGKIDRKALPAPNEVVTEQQSGYVAPTLPVHHQLVEIWEELLPVHPIGVRDNFFDLGGHSLLAARMMQRVEQISGKKIPLATLFADATIEHLAAILTEPATPDPRTTLVTIQSTGTLPPFFFVPGDWNGGGFYCLEMAKVFGPDRPFYVLDPQALGPDEVPLTIPAMAAEHVRSLQSVQPNGPYYLGGFCIGGLIAYEMARQLRAAGHEVATLVMIDSSPARPRRRLMRAVLERSRHLNRQEKLERFTRLNDLITLMGRAEIRGWQVLTGQWRRLLQREKPDLDSSVQVDSATAQQWMAIYLWAAAGYVPEPYQGAVTLLWARENLADSPRDYRRFWRRLTTEVDFHLIPGSHLSCITHHTRDMAAQIKRCLEGQRLSPEES